MNPILEELHRYIDETYAEACKMEDTMLNKQMENALRMLRHWKTKMRGANPKLFHYTLVARIPYWEHWVKKYKCTTPGMVNYLQNIWDEYSVLEDKGDLNGLDTLF